MEDPSAIITGISEEAKCVFDLVSSKEVDRDEIRDILDEHCDALIKLINQLVKHIDKVVQENSSLQNFTMVYTASLPKLLLENFSRFKQHALKVANEPLNLIVVRTMEKEARSFEQILSHLKCITAKKGLDANSILSNGESILGEVLALCIHAREGNLTEENKQLFISKMAHLRNLSLRNKVPNGPARINELTQTVLNVFDNMAPTNEVENLGKTFTSRIAMIHYDGIVAQDISLMDGIAIVPKPVRPPRTGFTLRGNSDNEFGETRSLMGAQRLNVEEKQSVHVENTESTPHSGQGNPIKVPAGAVKIPGLKSPPNPVENKEAANENPRFPALSERGRGRGGTGRGRGGRGGMEKSWSVSSQIESAIENSLVRNSMVLSKNLSKSDVDSRNKSSEPAISSVSSPPVPHKAKPAPPVPKKLNMAQAQEQADSSTTASNVSSSLSPRAASTVSPHSQENSNAVGDPHSSKVASAITDNTAFQPLVSPRSPRSGNPITRPPGPPPSSVVRGIAAKPPSGSGLDSKKPTPPKPATPPPTNIQKFKVAVPSAHVQVNKESNAETTEHASKTPAPTVEEMNSVSNETTEDVNAEISEEEGDIQKEESKLDSTETVEEEPEMAEEEEEEEEVQEENLPIEEATNTQSQERNEEEEEESEEELEDEDTTTEYSESSSSSSIQKMNKFSHVQEALTKAMKERNTMQIDSKQLANEETKFMLRSSDEISQARNFNLSNSKLVPPPRLPSLDSAGDNIKAPPKPPLDKPLPPAPSPGAVPVQRVKPRTITVGKVPRPQKSPSLTNVHTHAPPVSTPQEEALVMANKSSSSSISSGLVLDEIESPMAERKATKKKRLFRTGRQTIAEDDEEAANSASQEQDSNAANKTKPKKKKRTMKFETMRKKATGEASEEQEASTNTSPRDEDEEEDTDTIIEPDWPSADRPFDTNIHRECDLDTIIPMCLNYLKEHSIEAGNIDPTTIAKIKAVMAENLHQTSIEHRNKTWPAHIDNRWVVETKLKIYTSKLREIAIDFIVTTIDQLDSKSSKTMDTLNSLSVEMKSTLIPIADLIRCMCKRRSNRTVGNIVVEFIQKQSTQGAPHVGTVQHGMQEELVVLNAFISNLTREITESLEILRSRIIQLNSTVQTLTVINNTISSTDVIQLFAIVRALSISLPDVLDLFATRQSLSKNLNERESGKRRSTILSKIEDKSLWAEIKECKDMKLEGGVSLNGLIAHLTSTTAHDVPFMKAFVTSYRSFTDPMTFLRKLQERYTVPLDASENESSVHMRVCVVMDYWIQNDPTQFQDDYIQVRVTRMADQFEKDGHVGMAKKIQKALALNKRQKDMQNEDLLLLTEGLKLVDSCLAAPMDFILGLDERMLAEQLTLVDFSIFSRIQPSELLNLAWSKPKLHHRAPNARALIRLFNSIGLFVGTVILSNRNSDARALIMEKFIRIAEILLELHNFNSLMGILSGMSMSCVDRLRKTKAKLSPVAVESLEKIRQIMTPTSSWKTYRQLLKNSTPAVPYLGVWLTDLTFIEDGNPDIVDELINFPKRLLVSKIITQMQDYQRTSYSSIKPLPIVQSYLKAMPTLDDDTLYKLSISREPRERQQRARR